MDKNSLMLTIIEISKRIEDPKDRKTAIDALLQQFKTEAVEQSSKNEQMQQMEQGQKSLTNYGKKAGYTGRLVDALGRQRCFQGGKLVSCGSMAKDPKKMRQPASPVGEVPEKRPKGEEIKGGESKKEEEKPVGRGSTAAQSKEQAIERIDAWLEQVQRQAFVFLKESEKILELNTKSVLKVIVKAIANYNKGK